MSIFSIHLWRLSHLRCSSLTPKGASEPPPPRMEKIVANRSTLRKAYKRNCNLKCMIKKILFTEGRKISVRDITKDFHTEFGFYKAADLKRKGKIVSNTGKEAYLLDASFIDCYEKIKRAPQIIPLKDVGLIIAKTGIGKKTKILDAGTGSGGLAIFLGNIAKEVVSYELRPDFYEIAKKNIEELGLKNIILKNKDVIEANEKNFDAATLDMPDPWRVLENVKKCIRTGGFIVSYSPTVPQVMDFVKAVGSESSLLYLETIEILERQWEVDERKVRPKSQQIGHSGFLTFVRKVG